MRQAVFTEKGVTPGGPYSQVVILNGVAYVSSQGPIVPGTSTVPGTFQEQARQVFENVGILLTAAGSSFEQVVKVGVFLADLKYFAEMNDVYKQFFKPPYPARTTVQAGLSGDMLIVVDCIAEVSAK